MGAETITRKAIYRAQRLELAEPLPLEEGDEVFITVSASPPATLKQLLDRIAESKTMEELLIAANEARLATENLHEDTASESMRDSSIRNP